MHQPGVHEKGESMMRKHSCYVFAKELFPGHGPQFLAGEWGREGGGRGQWRRGMCKKRRRKVGMGPEEKGWGCRHAELTHRHVRACSNKGVGHGIYELATHTKVAQFDLPTRVDKDVGGLDIYVAEGIWSSKCISSSEILLHSVTQHLPLDIDHPSPVQFLEPSGGEGAPYTNMHYVFINVYMYVNKEFIVTNRQYM